MEEWADSWCQLLGFTGGCYGLSPAELAIVFGLALVGAMIAVLVVFKLAARL